jgi:hypothetical protein
MPTGRSSKYAREKLGLIPTFRGPVSRIVPGFNPVFNFPITAPLPPPHRLELPTPDAGPAKIWPWGAAGDTAP